MEWILPYDNEFITVIFKNVPHKDSNYRPSIYTDSPILFLDEDIGSVYAKLVKDYSISNCRTLHVRGVGRRDIVDSTGRVKSKYRSVSTNSLYLDVIPIRSCTLDMLDNLTCIDEVRKDLFLSNFLDTHIELDKVKTSFIKCVSGSINGNFIESGAGIINYTDHKDKIDMIETLIYSIYPDEQVEKTREFLDKCIGKYKLKNVSFCSDKGIVNVYIYESEHNGDFIFAVTEKGLLCVDDEKYRAMYVLYT